MIYLRTEKRKVVRPDYNFYPPPPQQLVICQCLLLTQEPRLYVPKDAISLFSPMIIVFGTGTEKPGLRSP